MDRGAPAPGQAPSRARARPRYLPGGPADGRPPPQGSVGLHPQLVGLGAQGRGRAARRSIVASKLIAVAHERGGQREARAPSAWSARAGRRRPWRRRRPPPAAAGGGRARATREACADVAPRPSASAACTGIRPARQAGSAVAAATTTSVAASASASSAGPGAPVRWRAEHAGGVARQPLCHQRAGDEASGATSAREHEVVRDEHARDPGRGESDRPQQPDLPALREHPPADRGGEREGRREQREQCRRLQDRQQAPPFLGQLGPPRAPVLGPDRSVATGPAREGGRVRRLGEPQADAEPQRPLGGGERAHVGWVGPAAAARTRRRADPDHPQLALRAAAARRRRRRRPLRRARACSGG